MDPTQFQSKRAGRPIRVNAGSLGEFWAFDPVPVPRELDLRAELVVALSEADHVLGRLAGLGELLPNPHLLIQPYLRREAVSSTRIEGTQSSLSEVLSAEAQLLPETPDLREVFNYVRAFERGLMRLESLPLSNRLIRELHEELLRGVRGAERTPGEFRRTPNWIGGRRPDEAVFVPPPPERLPDAMGDLEAFIHEDVALPNLVKCALVHYQFETIHPFLDGNGRLGRLLVAFYLVERGLLRQPLLYLSAYLERHKEEYIARLQAVREEGDYEAWVTFFLRAVSIQGAAAIDAAESLLRLAADYRERLRRVRARGQVIEAAESLIGNPYVTAPRLADELGITRQGALYIISTLKKAGIVDGVRQNARPALFVAAEVLQVLERGGE